METRFNAKFKGEGDLEIGEVTADGVAAKLGLMAGDKLVSMDGDELGRLLDFALAMRNAEGKAKLVVVRGGEKVELEIDTASLPSLRAGRRGNRQGRRRGGQGQEQGRRRDR